LVSAGGRVTVLHGTDVSGSAYACEQDAGFSDTPTGSSLYSAMVGNDGGALPKDWSINSVTLGLNQDCWLGINGVPSAYSGENYINFVKAQVASMEQVGIYPVLALFVGEPGTDTPNWYSTGNGNAPMPDNDHVPLFWEEVASAFKDDPDVIFRLYEEPWPNFYANGAGLATWQCWSHGDDQYGPASDSVLASGWESSPGTQPAPTPTGTVENCDPLQQDAQGTTYRSVGFQSLVNIIRGVGADNIIQIPGVAFADALSCTNTGSPVSCGFLDSADGVEVKDTLSSPQLMADVDNYPDVGQFVNSLTSVEETYDPVMSVMPFDCGECGVNDNSSPFPLIEQFIENYDSLGQS
jgi:hypothetical protein